jgi:uncharacterized protein (DUF1684 family)
MGRLIMKKIGKKLVPLLGIMVLFFFSFQAVMEEGRAVAFGDENENFVKEEVEWRAQRDKQMRSSTSWLTIAGLFWLEEGENSFGTDSSNNIKLPENSASPVAGKFVLKDDKVKVVAHEGVILKVAGKHIEQMMLRGDEVYPEEPDVVELDDLRMWVIRRGERSAIRLRDLNAAAYKNYKGLDFYPPTKKFKIEATFVPFPSPKTITIATVINTEEEMKSPGYVKFVIDGKEFRLDAFAEDAQSKQLFFIFKDETNGDETYGAGRFMTSNVLENGKVDINFNRAYNPPCAYTPYATCPLAPEQNWLKVRIEAGEKNYAGGHH